MSLRIEEAVPGHARIVIRNMRARDLEEVLAGWGNPENAIQEAIAASPDFARTAFWELEPVAIFGMRRLTVMGASAEVWCFGTRAIDRHRMAFLRASRAVVAEMHELNPMLTNQVDANDHEAIKWLSWLGASSALPPQMRGGRLFAQFFLTRPIPKESTCQLA